MKISGFTQRQGRAHERRVDRETECKFAQEIEAVIEECSDFVAIVSGLQQLAKKARSQMPAKFGQSTPPTLGFATNAISPIAAHRLNIHLTILSDELKNIEAMYEQTSKLCIEMLATLFKLRIKNEQRRRDQNIKFCSKKPNTTIQESLIFEWRSDVRKLADTLFILATHLEESEHWLVESELAIVRAKATNS